VKVLRFTACVLLVALLLPSTTRAQQRTLTTALEVRSLTPAEAASGIPVHLRGVIVYVEDTSAIFVQDETSTTFFRTRQIPLPKFGDEIELDGVTRMGLYLPGIDYSTYRVLGQRPLPPGIPAQFDDLVFGRFHYQRVTLEGIIRSVAVTTGIDPRNETGEILAPVRDGEKEVTEIRLAMGSRVIEAHLRQPPPAGVSFVDRRVRLTGLAVGVINQRRQLVKPSLRLVDWAEVEMLTPAPPASEVPLISAEDLLAYRITGRDERRVRVEGIVTAVFPEYVFLRQGPVAFGASLSPETVLAPGDRVTIAGFPEMVRSSATVVDAELLSREPGPPPPPDIVESPDELQEAHDCKLVSVTGLVRDAFQTEDGISLFLASKNRPLHARVPAGLAVPEIGARVNLTGIAQVELARRPTGFAGSMDIVRLRARTPADLVVLQNPPWWSARRLAVGLALLGGITALAGLWIAILRRQVRRQTEALRSRIESEAALEERQRIAREFHDTLEQELAGVSLRLDALATRELDEKGRHLIGASRNLVSRIQSETRDLIRDLRDSNEIAGDLAAALHGVAARLADENSLQIKVDAATPLPALPATTVHDLRMIAREAITNAIRHGASTQVSISVEHRDGELRLRITDDGSGFNPATVIHDRRGHFGCAGIRERARKSHAEVTWSNVSPRGTRVEVVLPLDKTGVQPGSASADAPVTKSEQTPATT
jgi:signal transduction histidine kinase